MYPHRMRLRGPWQFEPLARTVVYPDGRIEDVPGEVPPPGRMKMPADLSGTALEGFRGRVRWRRTFHPPRRLEAEERIWLVFEGADYFADVSLNGTSLGRHEGYFQPFEFDVTPVIGPRGDLVVEVDCPAEADAAHQRLIRGLRERRRPGFVGGLWGDVVLEVRAIAFLRDVQMQTELDGSRGRVMIAGRVVGESGIALGIELSVDRVWKTGQKIEATAVGAEFELETDVEPVEPWWPKNLGTPQTYEIQLELHGKARTLDAVSRRVGFRELAFDADWRAAELNGRRLAVMPLDIDELVNEQSRQRGDTAASGRLLDHLPAGRDVLAVGRTAGEVLLPDSYELTDSVGLLLQQDFPLAGRYSTDAALYTDAARQAAAMVRQVGHHPSIALWCCHTDPAEGDAELDRRVQAAISRLDATRPCVRGALFV